MKINHSVPIKDYYNYKTNKQLSKNDAREHYSNKYAVGVKYPSNYKNVISFTGGQLSDDNIKTVFPCFSDSNSIKILRKLFVPKDKFNKLKSLCEGVQDKKNLDYLTISGNSDENSESNNIIEDLSFICDNLNEEQIKEYKIFYKGENGKLLNSYINKKGFTVDDKIRLFKLRFNNIPNIDIYSDCKNNYPDLSFEEKISILQAYKRFNNDFKNINAVMTLYQTIKPLYIDGTQQKLSVEDGALCSSYYILRDDNSNDKPLTFNDFINRYIDIRNKNIENTDKKIVQRGKSKELKNPINYPVNLALKWAYEGKTDDDIEKEYRQIELITMGYDIETAIALSSLNDSQIDRYKELISTEQNKFLAIAIAQLDDKQYEKYQKLISDREEHELACGLAQLDDKQYEKYQELVSDGEEQYNALRIASKFDDKQYEKYRKLSSEMKDKYLARSIAQLNNKQYEKYQELISNGENDFNAYRIAQLDNKQYEKYQELISDGENDFNAYRIAQLDDKQYEKYQELISDGEDYFNVFKIVKLEKEQYQRFLTLKSQKIFFDYSLLKLDDKQYENYNQLISQGKTHNVALEIAQLDDKQYEKYNQLISQGKTHKAALEIAQLTDKQYKKYNQLISQGKTHNVALEIAQLDDKQYEKYQKLISKGIPPEQASVFALFYDKQYKKYNPLIPNKINKRIVPEKLIFNNKNSKYIENCLAQLNDEQYEKYKELISDGQEHEIAFEIAQLDNEQYEKYQELIFQGKTHSEALAFVKLTEDELQRINKRSRNLTSNEAYILAKETTLSFLTPEQIKELPENIFYLITTGQSKDINEAMQQAIKTAIETNFKDTAAVSITPKELSSFRTIKKDLNNAYSSKELNISLTGDNELNVKYNRKPNEFDVIIKKEIIEGKTVLFIQDNNSDKKYIAYNGIISLVDDNNIIPKDDNGNDIIDERTKMSLFSLQNMYPEKQAEILAKASKEFIFNIIDENGESIIGQGLNGETPYLVHNSSDKDIQKHFGEKLTQLKQNNQLTAENILRILPKDAILMIRPYALEDSNILYSIGAEWFGKDNNRWEMRIHSTDLNYAKDDAKWVFRLGYTHTDSLNNNVTTYFQYTDEAPYYNFDGEFSGVNSKNSHISIPSPIRENNLLNNVDFQKIIQQMSKICH